MRNRKAREGNNCQPSLKTSENATATMKALIESNKAIAEANRELAECNKILSDCNAELISKLKSIVNGNKEKKLSGSLISEETWISLNRLPISNS
jgi:hypothetical protein